MKADRRGRSFTVIMLGAFATGIATGILAGCNPRDLTVSITDRTYVAPPAPKKAEAPAEVVQEAPIASPQPVAAATPASRVIGDVYFDYDRADIKPEGKPVLKTAINALMAEKGRRLIIEGHCDERGTNEYNLVLGERRAKTVRDYLARNGIEPSRLHPTSYGKERPVCFEHRPGCWKKNRRAHLVLE